eukprot:144740-Pelagomonas_calceolata.AAC.1
MKFGRLQKVLRTIPLTCCLQARTQACVHLPQRLAYDINEPQQAANGMQPQEFDDSNALRINFDLRELNLVLRL